MLIQNLRWKFALGAVWCAMIFPSANASPEGDPAAASWLVERIQARHGVVGTGYEAKISAWAGPEISRKFSKVSGPGWLEVSADGALSGTPADSDAGLQEFAVRVEGSDPGGKADVPLRIEVFPGGGERVERFSVMTYNLWHQWTKVNGGYEKGIRSIVLSGADVIGMQESSIANARRVAEELGWHRAASGTGGTQIVSRYPIVESYTAGIAVGARIRLAESPVRDIIVFNCHLDYRNYGPYAARLEGATPSSVLREEARSQRPVQIAAILEGMADVLARADAVPVFLTGDFNAPSHLDWIPAAASSHGGISNVAWPVSSAVEVAGLVDSFRACHPDPVKFPGNSWSTIHKGGEPQDRIDCIYHKGSALRLLQSTMFATEVEAATGPWGDSIAPVANNTWPSDHYAFISTYAFIPPKAE